MTLDQHAAAARRAPEGMKAFVAALHEDAALRASLTERLKLYAEMNRAGRMEACVISRRRRETMAAALAAMKQTPGVPAGG